MSVVVENNSFPPNTHFQFAFRIKRGTDPESNATVQVTVSDPIEQKAQVDAQTDGDGRAVVVIPPVDVQVGTKMTFVFDVTASDGTTKRDRITINAAYPSMA